MGSGATSGATSGAASTGTPSIAYIAGHIAATNANVKIFFIAIKN